MTPDSAMCQLPNCRRIDWLVAVGAVVFLLLVIESIRRHRLKERYSLLWFATIGVVIVLTLHREWLDDISHSLGIHHAPSALLLVLVGFTMIILFHFSTVISGLLGDRTVLVQRLGVLDARYRRLEQELSELRAAADDPGDAARRP